MPAIGARRSATMTCEPALQRALPLTCAGHSAGSAAHGTQGLGPDRRADRSVCRAGQGLQGRAVAGESGTSGSAQQEQRAAAVAERPHGRSGSWDADSGRNAQAMGGAGASGGGSGARMVRLHEPWFNGHAHPERRTAAGSVNIEMPVDWAGASAVRGLAAVPSGVHRRQRRAVHSAVHAQR